MRTAPAVSVSVNVPAAAGMTVALLGFASTAVALVWAWAGGGGLRFGAPLASLALTLHLLVELHAVPTRRLRWDGVAWWLKPDRSDADEVPGEVSIACDLGPFVLLRFAALATLSAGRRGVWLPLQRSAVDGDWHALRCAMYSPRARRPSVASEAIDG